MSFDDSSDEDSAVAFAYIDFSGVDFSEDQHPDETQPPLTADNEKTLVDITSQDKDLHITSLPMTEYAHQGKGSHISSTSDTQPSTYITVNKVGPDNTFLPHLSSSDQLILSIEKNILLSDCCIHQSLNDDVECVDDDLLQIHHMSQLLSQGFYLPILEGTISQRFFSSIPVDSFQTSKPTIEYLIRNRIFSYCDTVSKCVQVELLAVAALQLFLQFNYTGPSFDHGVDFETGVRDSKLDQWLHQGSSPDGESRDISSRLCQVHPHPVFRPILQDIDKRTDNSLPDIQDPLHKLTDPSLSYKINPCFQNAILAELAVDGEWPCPVSRAPYFLLLARSILHTLADPNRPAWSFYYSKTVNTPLHDSFVLRGDEYHRYTPPSPLFVTLVQHLAGATLWAVRAAVAHTRILQGDEPPLVLWDEVQDMFESIVQKFCTDVPSPTLDKLQLSSELYQSLPTKILLEYGLAQHHHGVSKKGKEYFKRALIRAGLDVSVTGSEGRRTKYQQKSTAQLLVRAKPRMTPSLVEDSASKEMKDTKHVKNQSVDHPDPDENPLLDKVEYEDKEDNIHHRLSILHQAILLALCLDVKNDNPMDGLTAEEMGAFLERVLQQHDDWMVFATGLLERAWLEYERNHTKMRAILQLQALADQHTHRLTITQSTVQAAVGDSAPPQERLRNLHYLVYPPRWQMLRDLAERYAQSGIVTSAAELFEEIELWDEVVECYRQAGKDGKAEEIVRTRLGKNETPKMWTALGDITKEPSHYHRAIELSRGRFSGAYAALGKYHFDKGELNEASSYFNAALRIKPHSPHMWFRLGTIAMRLQDWPLALQAFTEVVQQEPEEGDAWANVAAVHMYNRRPEEAYPALVESLKINRGNWRVWVSKLYTCIDLKKFDEAVHACTTLMDLRAKSDQVPQLEEKCIRAIVKGALIQFCEAEQYSNENMDRATAAAASLESAQRTLNRVNDLVVNLVSTAKSSDTWIYEVSAYLHKSTGLRSLMMEELMKEYRALQSVSGWETNESIFKQLCHVIDNLASLHLGRKTRDSESMTIGLSQDDTDSLKKFRYLLQGVIRKVRSAYFDQTKIPTTAIETLECYVQNINERL